MRLISLYRTKKYDYDVVAPDCTEVVTMLRITVPTIVSKVDFKIESLIDRISMREWNSRTVELHGELKWFGEDAELDVNYIKSESMIYKFGAQTLSIYCKQRCWEIELPLFTETFTEETKVQFKTDLTYINNQPVHISRTISLCDFYDSWYLPEYTILEEMVNKQNIDKTNTDRVIDDQYYGINLPVWYLYAKHYPQLVNVYLGAFPKQMSLTLSLFYEQLNNPLIVFPKNIYPKKVDLFNYLMRLETPYEGWEIGEAVLTSSLCLHSAGDQKNTELNLNNQIIH
jgi:hypothetical protein